jgi:isoquinoline 1-oxidoreductase subunit alpha
MPIVLNVNSKSLSTEIDHTTPLLWFLREQLALTGTKFGCGIGVCGACTVHIDGKPVQSCQISVGNVAGQNVTTIEGLSDALGKLHPVQEAWIEQQVPQCGYCQSGQIMTAVALLESNASPSDADIDSAMTNICRCGTYPRIRQAIHDIAKKS